MNHGGRCGVHRDLGNDRSLFGDGKLGSCRRLGCNHSMRLDYSRRFDYWRVFHLNFNRWNVIGREFFHHGFGRCGSFLFGGLSGGFHFGAKLGNFGVIPG